MKLIYDEKKVPCQWLEAKKFPVHKNYGNSKNIKNYIPIANLFSSSKLFIKHILKQMLESQDAPKINLTGEKQHRFKRNRSTSAL